MDPLTREIEAARGAYLQAIESRAKEVAKLAAALDTADGENARKRALAELIEESDTVQSAVRGIVLVLCGEGPADV